MQAPGLPPMQPRPHSALLSTPLFLRAASSQRRPVPALSGTHPCWLSGVGSLLPFLLVFWPLLLPCLWLPLCLRYHFVASSFLVFSLSGSSFSKMVFFSPSPQDSLSPPGTLPDSVHSFPFYFLWFSLYLVQSLWPSLSLPQRSKLRRCFTEKDRE